MDRDIETGDRGCTKKERGECGGGGGAQRKNSIIIIIDNFCIALFSGVHKLTALYNILRHFLH